MNTIKLEVAVLTIAGSDSCGGAGLQADLKTFSALGVYGASVVTALTAQNTQGVEAVDLASPEMVRAQLIRVLDDLPVRAIKTGMLGSAETIRVITDVLAGYPHIPIIMDPVMVATSGAVLAEQHTIEAMHRLMKHATLVTPNLEEAAVLCGFPVQNHGDMLRATSSILDSGCHAVLLKGGHLSNGQITDMFAGPEISRDWQHDRLPGQYHGTGCTLSSAVAAEMALGADLEQAIGKAIDYVQGAMRHAKAARKSNLMLLDHQYLSRNPA